jgi:hypothetical protein
VRLDPQARAKAQDRASVLRDIRLIKRDPHGSRVRVLMAKFAIGYCDEASLPVKRAAANF